MTTKQLTDKQWLDEMIIELRLREVKGPAIGDAVAAVETHCAESGESALDAFGDPRGYARALDFPASQVNQKDTAGWVRTLAPTAAGLVGLYLVPGIVRASFEHAAVAVGWGEIAALGLLAGFVLLLALVPGVLRAMLHRWINGVLVLGGGITVMTMAQVLLDGTAFHLPLWLAVTLCLVALGASVVGMRVSAETDQDPIIYPRTQRPTSPAITRAVSWIFVVSAIALALLSAIPLWFATR